MTVPKNGFMSEELDLMSTPIRSNPEEGHIREETNTEPKEIILKRKKHKKTDGSESLF